MPSNCKKQCGAALVSVLWTVAILTSIAGVASLESRTDVKLSRNQIDTAQLQQLEAAGIRLGVASIVERSRSRITPGALLERTFSIDNHRLQVSVINEAGRVDINEAPRELILGLVSQFADDDKAASIADAMLDWRDSDDDRRLAGAEERDYFADGLNYAPANARFLSVGELLMVNGVELPIFDKLKDHVTVYSGQAGVFPTAADHTVLRAAGGVSSDRSKSVGGQVGAISGLRRNLIALRPGNIYRIKIVVTAPDGMQSRQAAVIRFEPARRPEPFILLMSGLDNPDPVRAVQR